jgi:hypothetical protein
MASRFAIAALLASSAYANTDPILEFEDGADSVVFSKPLGMKGLVVNGCATGTPRLCSKSPPMTGHCRSDG